MAESSAGGGDRFSGIVAHGGVNHFGRSITYTNYYGSEATSDAKRKKLLDALAYEGMRTRRDQLADKASSPGSLDWIWSTKFADWLKSSESIFWISGKPGSGKSTLMKYLADHDSTRVHLRATGRSWRTLQFFFDFNVGSEIANTPEGMLRSFIIQLLQLIPECVDRLDEGTVSAPNDLKSGHLIELISNLLGNLNEGICTFIDGLDEYTGDMEILISRLYQLRDRTGIRMCLASRPGIALSAHLKQHQNLILQEYNTESIRKYVDTTFRSEGLVGETSQQLQQMILQRANGVILWARFAIQEIISGLKNGDNIAKLKETLGEIPEEMESIYKRILQKLTSQQSHCRTEAIITFQLIRCAKIRIRVDKLYRALSAAIAKTDAQASFLHRVSQVDFPNRLRDVYGGLFDLVEEDLLNPEGWRNKKDAWWRDGPFIFVRPCHETVQSFLTRSAELSELWSNSHCCCNETQLWLLLYGEVLQKHCEIDQQLFKTIKRCRVSGGAVDVQAVDDILSVMHQSQEYSDIFIDALSDTMAIAWFCEEDKEQYVHLISRSLRCTSMTYHVHSCGSCNNYAPFNVGDHCNHQLGKCHGLFLQSLQISQQRELLHVKIAVRHGLNQYLETYIRSLSLRQRQELFDFAVTGRGVSVEILRRVLEFLFSSGARTEGRHLCCLLRSSMFDGSGILDLIGKQEEKVSLTHDELCDLKDDFSTYGNATMLCHWSDGIGDLTHLDFIRLLAFCLSLDNTLLNQKCYSGGTILHYFIDRHDFNEHDPYIALPLQITILLKAGADQMIQGKHGNVLKTIRHNIRAHKQKQFFDKIRGKRIKDPREEAQLVVLEAMKEISKYLAKCSELPVVEDLMKYFRFPLPTTFRPYLEKAFRILDAELLKE